MPLKGKQIQASIYLDPEVHAELRRLTERTGVPMAVYLRKAVDNVLTENRLKPKRAKK